MQLDRLSEPERRQLEGMRFPARRGDWLAGRLAIRQLFAGLGYPLEGIEIANEPSGAPFARRVASGERLPGCLSISHRQGHALCAYTPHKGVGIGADLERVEPRSEAFCRDYFTEDERFGAEGWEDETRARWFNLLWSLKESCMKAAKRGLRIDALDLQVEVEGFEWPLPAGWKPARAQNLRTGERFSLAWELRGESLLTLGWEGAGVTPKLEEIQA